MITVQTSIQTSWFIWRSPTNQNQPTAQESIMHKCVCNHGFPHSYNPMEQLSNTTRERQHASSALQVTGDFRHWFPIATPISKLRAVNKYSYNQATLITLFWRDPVIKPEPETSWSEAAYATTNLVR